VSTLIFLKNKIRSIQTTRKITHAVRLSSMAVYSKLEKQNKFLNEYSLNIANMFSELLAYSSDWKNKTFLPMGIRVVF